MSEQVTGLIVVKNEERDLSGCLSAIESVCNRIIVVNDGSTDDTVKIATQFGCDVIDAQMDQEMGFAGLRNKGMDEVDTAYALTFDADERPNAELLQAISDVLKHNPTDQAFSMRFRHNAFQGWLDHGRFGTSYSVHHTRLFPSSVRYYGAVHEAPQLSHDQQITSLPGVVEHFTYASLKEYIEKMRSYAESDAISGRVPSLSKAVATSAYNIAVRQGYKDGWRGFAMALGDTGTALLTRHYAKQM